jgi:hypothetical protein
MNLFGNRRGFSKPRRGEGRREPTFDLIEEPTGFFSSLFFHPGTAISPKCVDDKSR